MPSVQDMTLSGSSPHTWRILQDGAEMLGVARIISTYVENTITRSIGAQQDEDHLHIRGEYSSVSLVHRID